MSCSRSSGSGSEPLIHAIEVNSKAEAMRLASRPHAAFLQRPNEPFPIRIVAKDVLAMIATIHDVVDGFGILDSQLANHKTPRAKPQLMQSSTRITHYNCMTL